MSKENQSNTLLPLVPVLMALLLCQDTMQLHKSWAKEHIRLKSSSKYKAKSPQNKTKAFYSGSVPQSSSSYNHTSIYEVFAEASFIYKAITNIPKQIMHTHVQSAAVFGSEAYKIPSPVRSISLLFANQSNHFLFWHSDKLSTEKETNMFSL